MKLLTAMWKAFILMLGSFVILCIVGGALALAINLGGPVGLGIFGCLLLFVMLTLSFYFNEVN